MIIQEATLTPFLLPNNLPHSIPQDYLDFDFFSSDDFRMFEFKIRPCPRGGRSHDWTRCPFAHPGEKARRRDPRKFPYSATPCPDFRRHSTCKKGDSCDFSHGVFESWLHPSRYRTHLCKDLNHCRRRVCFFAHSLDQLRVLTRSPRTTSRSSSMSSNVYVGSPKGSGELCFGGYEKEVCLERVESGRDLRDEIYANLANNETSYGGSSSRVLSVPDFGWVSELVN